MISKLKATNVYRRNLQSINQIVTIGGKPEKKYRYIVNQGGTRSSKTFSIAQIFIVKLLTETGKVLTIARKTSPSLRSTVMRDFFEILISLGLYDEKLQNKTNKEYFLNGNLVEFISLDEPQKKRGGKRNYLWLNESNEFNYEDFFQLDIRTSDLTIFDFNPSDAFHWIHDKIIPKSDCAFIQSSYLDNPFLPDSIKRNIENLKDEDGEYWKIYGLGEKGILKDLIYTNWDIAESFSDRVDEVLYGIDFGFNNPSVVLKIGVADQKDIYIQELLYESKLTNQQLIDRMLLMDISKSSEIKADSEAPDRIEEIYRAGFNITGAKKGKGSVEDGIDIVKRKRLHITKDSSNVIKEIKSYKFKKDKEDKVLNDSPIKFNDHAMDALRYAIGEIENCYSFAEIKSPKNRIDRITAGMMSKVF